jgi:hypothetical protein
LSKIVLDIDDKNIDIVLVILKNLKQGLIKNISTDKKNINTSLETKKAVRKNVALEDFESTPPSTGKYLSKAAYKNKLNKG